MITKLDNHVLDVRDVLYFKRESQKITVVFKTPGVMPLEIYFSSDETCERAINKIFDDYCKFNARLRNKSLFNWVFGFSLF